MKRNIPLGIFIGVLVLVVATALALLVLHVWDGLYIRDMRAFAVCEEWDLSEEVALRNYNAVMAWLSPFNTQPFDLPDFAFTETGAIHFEEVRVIFRGVYILGAGCLAALAALFLLGKNARSPRCLKAASITTVALPALILSVIAADADRAFVLFHKIFFRNDYWIFDYHTDEIIKILPQGFFIHCALFIAVFWVAAAAVLLVLARRGAKSN